MLCYHIYKLKSLAQFNVLSGIPTMRNIRSLLRQTHRFACFMMMLCFASVSFAETPHVAADIAPVHSLVARVMDGVGAPSLIIAPGASPHEYSLRPSEAAALQHADVIFWIGPDLTPWLDNAMSTLADDAVIISLLKARGTTLLPYRDNALFERHDHDGDHDDHSDHDDDGQGHIDPHLWLSPDNGMAWLNHIAEVLAEADPANAAAYRANAAAGQTELAKLQAEINAVLKPHRGKNFILFHDGFQYFEHHFDVPSRGAIAFSDASQPGPARLAAIRGRIIDDAITCVLSEPQYQPGIIAAVTVNAEVNIGVVDAIGYDRVLGRDLYPQLLRGVAEALAECLK